MQEVSASDIEINLEPSSSSKPEPKSENVVKKRGRKRKTAKEIVRLPNSSKLPHVDSKESSEVNIHTELRKASPEDSSVDPNDVENMSDSSKKRSSLEVTVNNVITLSSTSQSESLHGKILSKRNRKSKKVTSNHEKTPLSLSINDDAPDGLDTESRLLRSEKNSRGGVVDTTSKLISLVEVKMKQDNDGESDTPLKQSSFKLGVTDGTPRTKKRGRPRKVIFEYAILIYLFLTLVANNLF